MPNRESHRFWQGERFQRDIDFPDGTIRCKGTVGVDRATRTLLLWDVDIKPVAGDRLDLGPRAVRQLFATLIALAAADDFDTLIVNGYRISGANPRRFLEVSFDCRPFRAARRPLQEAKPEDYDMAGAKPAVFVPGTLEAQASVARQMLAEGRSLEDVWRMLRDAGLDMIASKDVTMQVTGMPSPEAGRALYLSDTWADLRPAIDQLEDAIIETALEMGATVKLDGQIITSWPSD